MRSMLKALGIVACAFFILVFATASVVFIRRTWFGGGSIGAHVAVLDINGILISSEDTIEKIKNVLEQGTAKALVIRVNSPGGMVGPSQEIYQALAKADQKIPVVVSMGSVAASGGYYLALGGRHIFANSGTLTGSIGVIMEFFNTEKLYKWAKIERFSLTAGRMKDAGSPLKKMTAEERDLFIRLLEDVHSEFKATVRIRRKLTEEEVNKIADGRVLTGHQAHQAKLVDSLGGVEEAIAEAKKLAKLPENAPVEFEDKKEGLLRKLLLGESAESRLLWNSLRQVVDQFKPLTQSSFRVLLLAPIDAP